jgi:hypothetical protein
MISGAHDWRCRSSPPEISAARKSALTSPRPLLTSPRNEARGRSAQGENPESLSTAASVFTSGQRVSISRAIEASRRRFVLRFLSASMQLNYFVFADTAARSRSAAINISSISSCERVALPRLMAWKCAARCLIAL